MYIIVPILVMTWCTCINFISEDTAAVLKRASMDQRRFEDAHRNTESCIMVSQYVSAGGP